MTTLTFVLGMERFNAHMWREVEANLAREGVNVRLLRFHDDHIAQRDPALIRAIHEGDVLFLTLINNRDHAERLAEWIAEGKPKAVFAFESMPEVMSLTRVGDYTVKGGGGRANMPKPMQVVLKLLTRGRDEDTLYAYSKLSKISSKLLPLMPAKLADFRTWLTVNIYWNQPDAPNITQMVKLILRDTLGQALTVAPVQMIPMMGCFYPPHPPTPLSMVERRAKTGTFHPPPRDGEGGRGVRSAQFFNDPRDYLKWAEKQKKYKKGQPLVALMAFRKHVVQGQQYLYDTIAALENEGLAVLPIFTSGIEAHVAVREWIAHQPIDLILNTMGFSIVGGPAGSTKPGQYHAKASDLLAGVDVPYMIAQPLQMQSDHQWHANGVAPMQAVILYDLPEMDGSVSPVVLGAIREQEIVATPDRLARMARQAAGWSQLRRKHRKERRLGLVLYNYPPGLGKLGTAALLDVPATLFALLNRLKKEGYQVGTLPASAEALAQHLGGLEGSASAQYPSANHPTLTVQEYDRLVPTAQGKRIDAYWGRPPGEIAPSGANGIRLDGLTFGNVFIGLQPPLGVPGDPMRLLFDKTFTPHHQYVAFYRWLRHKWGADALVHIGMHGTAEWMPGLQLGLTGECWSDFLLGELPNFYLYPMNNPAESGIARRRGYATIISHAIPPYARAGLYKQLANAKAAYDADDGTTLSKGLPDLPRTAEEAWEAYKPRLHAYLTRLEERLISDGLHIFGQSPAAEHAETLITAALDMPRQGKASLGGLLAQSGITNGKSGTIKAEWVRRSIIGREPPDRAWQSLTGMTPSREIQPLYNEGKALLAGIRACDQELEALVHALDGGYIRPAHGADPVRGGSAAFPTGRNIHSIDPWRLPTDPALERGREMVVQLLARHQAEHGKLPQTVALTLWALDTIKTEGETLGAVLACVGARPVRDGQNKIWKYDLIPLAELGRPRVDVLLDISPIFRDTFQMTLDLLDDCFRRAAAAEDEPRAMNPIRAHALDMQAKGVAWEQATARIFTQAPGLYGTGVDERIDESQWESQSELVDTYLHRGAHTYGGTRGGTAAPEVLRGMLGTVDHVFHAIDSVEYGLTDMQHYYGHSGAMQLAAKSARGQDVPLTYAESYTGQIQLTAATDLLQIEARTKFLNPRWYEGMLAHGYAGAAEIGNRFTYLVGWSAVTDAVPNWVYDNAAQTFVLDDVMRERLATANPQAARNAVARLLEANGRNLWQTDPATLEQLQALYADLEDRLEGVTT
jgi:magnesium chelatase subunit H